MIVSARSLGFFVIEGAKIDGTLSCRCLRPRAAQRDTRLKMRNGVSELSPGFEFRNLGFQFLAS